MRIGITRAIEPTRMYSLNIDDIPLALVKLVLQAVQEFEKKASNYERTLRSTFRCAWVEYHNSKAHWTNEDQGYYACRTCFKQRRVCLVPSRVENKACFVILPLPSEFWPGEFKRSRASWNDLHANVCSLEDETFDPANPVST